MRFIQMRKHIFDIIYDNIVDILEENVSLTSVMGPNLMIF